MQHVVDIWAAAGEFLNIEVKFDFFAAESLATIKLDVRRPVQRWGAVRAGRAWDLIFSKSR